VLLICINAFSAKETEEMSADTKLNAADNLASKTGAAAGTNKQYHGGQRIISHTLCGSKLCERQKPRRF